MKKLIYLCLAMIMVFYLAACGDSASKEPETVGQILLADFEAKVEENAEITAQELADDLITNEVIAFMGVTMPVEPGLLMGFGNAEITGFEEGVMFAPNIGTIPFIGYVFTLAEGTDAESFVKILQDNADPRWNICTEAEETVVDYAADKVFFVMCPSQFEEQSAE